MIILGQFHNNKRDNKVREKLVKLSWTKIYSIFEGELLPTLNNSGAFPLMAAIILFDPVDTSFSST